MPIDFHAWLEQEDDELIYDVDQGTFPLTPPDPSLPGTAERGSCPGPYPEPCPAEVD